MKKLILPLIFLSITCSGQNYDSLRRVIEEIKVDQYRIELNLDKANEQFSSGTLLMGVGIGASVIGTLLYSINSEDPGPFAPSLMIAGGAAAATGWIIQIDSHKWFGRGRRK